MAGESRGISFERAIAARGGIEWIAAEVAAGRSLRSMAREISCGRWWLDRWIYADVDRKGRVMRARARARVAGAARDAGDVATGKRQQPWADHAA